MDVSEVIVEVEDTDSQIMRFRVKQYDDESIGLVRLLSKDIEKIDIPSEINGKQVKYIEDDCFHNCEFIKRVHIPYGIERIGLGAFSNCRNLEELILPDSITEIGNSAFMDCKSLKKVVFSKNIKVLPNGLFSFCEFHTFKPEIILPEGLEVIEEGAFFQSGRFDLIIPDSVKEIKRGAFFWGPRVITKRPYDEAWDRQWPFGELIKFADGEGKITEVRPIGNDCDIYEVELGTATRQFFFPCDYLDNIFSFADDKNNESMDKSLEDWTTQEKENAYKVRDNWRRGLV